VRATWTFAVYANADNNLEYTWPRFTLPALRALPANADVNVVALIDWRSVKKGVQLLQISGRRVKVVATWPDKDFGAGSTFAWFLRQVAARFPSDHLAVDIWDHGYGWRYVSNDFTSHDRMTMPELDNALRRAAVPVDILCFDACNMANIEAVDEFGSSGLVRYMVGSEETIDQDGYPYGGALRPLMADPSRTPRQVAGDLVDAWQAYYRPLRCFDWVSLSALDVDRVTQAKADLTAWVSRLRADLPQYRSRYAADLHHSIYAWDCWYVDLADVAGRLAADPAIADTTLKSLSTTVAGDLTASVVALSSGSYADRFKGLTIWWGTGSDWRSDADTYRRQIAFARDTGWYAFLKAYNAGHRPGPSQAPDPYLHRAAYGLTDIAFADADHGWATGYDNATSEAVILHTTDGGRHWTTKSPPWWYAYETSALALLDRRRAWAVGSEGYDGSAILKTTDGGRSWGWQTGKTVQYLLGVDFLDPYHGWLVGSRGTLLRTADGGRTWNGSRGVSDTDLWSVAFVDAAHGWVAGGNAAATEGVIRHTGDGGATWATQADVAGSVIYKIRAIDDSQAWAVGGNAVSGGGVILHTSDGGASWQTQYGGGGAPWLSGATFLDASTGWVVGEHGTVLRTGDGGLTWTTVGVPTREDLTAVWFTDAANGWIVGDGEAMLHTIDGGTTWTTTVADVTGPRTFAPAPVTVDWGARTPLRYRVDDARSATATVTIEIRGGGHLVKTLRLGRRTTGARHEARFVCRLARGGYRFSVYARDEAGNPQTRLGWNILTVK
jgi:photosystem II stability/assembly factor-like uncharacterized protein